MATQRFQIVVTAQGTRQVQRDIQNIGSAASITSRALSFMRSALVAVAGFRILSNLAQQLDLFTELSNRLRLVTNNTRELALVQDALFIVAQKTRADYEGTVVVFQRLAQTTSHLGLTYKQLLELTTTVNQAVALSGASAQSAAAGLRQFAQALASGVLQGDELRSVVENLPVLATLIGKQFGVAGAGLLALNKQTPGIIKLDNILKALTADSTELKKAFAETQFTIGQALTILNNAITFFFGKLSATTGAGQFLAKLLIQLADNIDKVVLALVAFAGVVAFNFIIGQVALLNTTLLTLASTVTAAFFALGRALVSPFLLLVTVLGPAVAGIRLLGATAIAAATSMFTLRTATVAAGTAMVVFGRISALLAGILAAIRATAAGFVVLVAVTRGAAIGTVALSVALGTMRGVITALTVAMRVLAAATLANPLFVGGALVVGGIIAGFILLKDRIESVIDSFGGLRNIFNVVVAGAIAAVNAIIANWRILPDAFADLAIQAANFLIEKFGLGVNKVIDLLNIIPGIDILPVNLPQIENAFEGSAKKIADTFISEYTRVKDADPFAVSLQSLENLLALTKQFTLGGLNEQAILDQLGDRKPPPTGGGGLAEVDKGLKKVISSLEALVSKISPAVAGMLELNDASLILARAQERGIDISERFGITQEEVFRRVQRELAGVGNEATSAQEKIKLVQDALANNAVTMEEASRRIRDINIELLEGQTTVAAGIERTFLKLQKSVDDVASGVEDALNSAFKSAEDSVVEFAQTGRVSVGTFLKDIEEMLLRSAVRTLFASAGAQFGFGQQPSNSLLGNIFGGGAGGSGTNFLSEIGSSLSGLFGFANGGSFMVGPGSSLGSLNGVDNRLVAFKAKDGERVTVTPKGESGGSVVVNFNVQANDVDSFRRSQGQIMTDAQIALSRAAARNG